MSGPGSSRVTAVVVNFNSGNHLLACVQSLRAEGVTDVRVADNGSSDRSLEALSGVAPPVTVIRTGANFGYGGGVNRGAAGARTGDLLLVCNADVVIGEGAVERMVRALDRFPDLGIVGPSIENVDGTLYPSARTFPDLVVALGHAALGLLLPNNRFTRRYRMLDWDHASASDVDWVSGACFVIRRRLFEGLGGFDESYFMYLEDVDLCWRVWRSGWRVRFEPAATVMHVQGVSTDQRPYRMLIAHHRSMLRFALRTTTGAKRLLLPVVVLGLAGRLGLALAQRYLAGLRGGSAKPAVHVDARAPAHRTGQAHRAGPPPAGRSGAGAVSG